MKIGERWGYRAHNIDSLVEVEVLKIGTQKPPRTLVRFIDEQFEGRQEWIPPTRLKVIWKDAVEFEAREARWDRVDTHPGLEGGPIEFAIDEVFRTLINEELAIPAYRYTGVTAVKDVAGLAGYLQLDESLLRDAPESFDDEDGWIVPWATTELIVRTACTLFSDKMLHEVEKQESEVQLESTHGRWYKSYFNKDENIFVTPEEVASSDFEEPDGKRCRDLLRQWCGAEAVARQDELKALRQEVVRLDDELVTHAIRVLRTAKLTTQADDIQRRFGVPIMQARKSR